MALGVETEYNTYLPSLDMPNPVTLPNFHNSSGVMRFCAKEEMERSVVKIKNSFFIAEHIYCG